MRLSSITADTEIKDLINVKEVISVMEAGCNPSIDKLKLQVSTITSEVAAGKGLSPSVYLAEGLSVLNSEALKVRTSCANTREILNVLVKEATKKAEKRRKTELLDLKTKVSLRKKSFQADVAAVDEMAATCNYDIYEMDKIYVNTNYDYKKEKITEYGTKMEKIDAELGKLGGE